MPPYPRADERLRMVEYQIAARGIHDQRVLSAMKEIPRHLFVPPPYDKSAYEDCPLPIGNGQTISQPYIVATDDRTPCHSDQPIVCLKLEQGVVTRLQYSQHLSDR